MSQQTMVGRAVKAWALPILGAWVLGACMAERTPETASAETLRSERAPTAEQASTDPRVDALYEELIEPDEPGAVVLVAKGDEVLHAKGYGLADVEAGRPLTPTTPVRLASVSKQFTGMAILLLAEDGRLSLDDPVSLYVPEIERLGDGITLRHLLHHTSGVPDYYADPGLKLYARESADDDPLLTNADLAALYREWGEPATAPGEQFAYSNPGYELLGLTVARVSGKSFGEFLEERVFEPLGMKDSAVRERPETEIPGRAIGYQKTARGFREFDDHPANWVVGAGGVYASAEDLLRWNRALARHALVSERGQEAAFTSGVLTDGGEVGYGFGWIVGQRGGRKTVEHRGAWVGFRTFLLHVPGEDWTVVVLANRADAVREPYFEALAKLYVGGAGS